MLSSVQIIENMIPMALENFVLPRVSNEDKSNMTCYVYGEKFYPSYVFISLLLPPHLYYRCTNPNLDYSKKSLCLERCDIVMFKFELYDKNILKEFYSWKEIDEYDYLKERPLVDLGDAIYTYRYGVLRCFKHSHRIRI